MLYKFKSKAAGDLIMLEPNGRRVLEIIGKDAGPQGIIQPGEMPAAIAALDAAIQREEAEQKAAIDEATAQGKVPPRWRSETSRQSWRAMMIRCTSLVPSPISRTFASR